ncbi:DinB family protein [Spirosoma soli]|uniref:DinB family protein n=1 Tax=Spirosoma soli TaxID=1770529 RepID=A0ABW5LYJ1_9BACT
MYAQPTGSIVNALQSLRGHIIHVPERLGNVPEIELAHKVPGKWSRKEILGHLIDSAINNLKRFTDAQSLIGQATRQAYQVQGYDQNNLVLINRYNDLPLAHLLALWSSLNTQIIYVADIMSAEALSISVQFGHTNQLNSEAPDYTLGWLIEDYVAHLEHHLKTLL